MQELDQSIQNFFYFSVRDPDERLHWAVMNESSTPTLAPTSKLVRALGPWMAIAIVAGTVIGSGVFKKPQVVSEQLPFSGLAAIGWVLGGLLALLGGLIVAGEAACSSSSPRSRSPRCWAS